MKYRIFRNISVLCPSLLSFHSYLLIFPFSILSPSSPFFLYPFPLFLALSLFFSLLSFFNPFLKSLLLFLFSWLSCLSIYLYLSLFLALLIYSDFGFVYASCWLIGFSESACNIRTLPVTLYAFHIYVKYTRVMSVDWCWYVSYERYIVLICIYILYIMVNLYWLYI